MKRSDQRSDYPTTQRVEKSSMERNDTSLRYDNRTFVRRGESRPSRDVNVSLYRNKLAGLGTS